MSELQYTGNISNLKTFSNIKKINVIPIRLRFIRLFDLKGKLPNRLKFAYDNNMTHVCESELVSWINYGWQTPPKAK